MRSRYLFFINLSELDCKYFTKVMKLDGDMVSCFEFLCKLFVIPKGLGFVYGIK
jgi:hypothetical protein